MTTLRRLASVLLLVPLAACSGGPELADPAPAAGSGGEAAASGGVLGAVAAASDEAEGELLPSYGGDQAERGRAVFRDRCSECHYASEMRGTQFQFQWERRTVGDLYGHLVETMPEDDPGSLTPTEYLEVVAYILRMNGFPEGPAELEEGSPSFEATLAAPSGSR
jgi:mono/diheme cytochrome c family protein